MSTIPVSVFLHLLRLLLTLAACGWTPTVAVPIWSNPDEMVHLYTFSPTRSFHLQIYSDGHVQGTPFETVNSAMVFRTDYNNHLYIVGVKSRLFLCMHSNGNLYGSSSFSNEDCTYIHHLLENTFEIYESVRHKLLLSLGNVKGRLGPTQNLPPFSKFVLRKNVIPLSWFD